MNLKAIAQTLLISFIIGLSSVFVNMAYEIKDLQAKDLIQDARHEERYIKIMESIERIEKKIDRVHND